MTKSQLLLEETTDYEVICYTRQQNSAAWKGNLTEEQYISREKKTSDSGISIKRDEPQFLGLHSFILKDLSLPTSGDKFDQIVAACETLNKRAWVAINGEVKEVAAPCIGGVYTLPHHRKKGYAEKMIEQVNKFWDEKLDKDSFIYLYSEVGDFYSRVGYKSFEVPVHKIKGLANFEIPLIDSKFDKLTFESYGDLIDNLSDNIKNKLIIKSKATSKHLYSQRPTLDQFTWFHIRDIHTREALSIESDKSECFGVKIDDENFIIWYHEWGSKELAVVKLSSSSFDSLQKLFFAAVKEVQNTNLDLIYLWDSTIPQDYHNEFIKFVEQTFPETKFDQSNGSISAIRPIDEKRRDLLNYSWENNEKWCWF
ncbi:hypothetical protein WICMUC_000320 [Wickerhamomyces mucosus]|uniref:LYC1 C-terminal domain-containing protein n=1 Tax=Wickerhamomyces mucosus TaxID=1378264 RepID=A0A9P8TIT6_9ASCO|nr:hypothetical protein WICMUC_000320 [Wickerhamomyces mucosus]